ncbi:MAG: hypothetical protein QOF35_1295 [Actinomycetota bacterium]|nr:hypothetical protein [Actinomycetota bacterium]
MNLPNQPAHALAGVVGRAVRDDSPRHARQAVDWAERVADPDLAGCSDNHILITGRSIHPGYARAGVDLVLARYGTKSR